MISTATSIAALACEPALAALPLKGKIAPILTVCCANAPPISASDIAAAESSRSICLNFMQWSPKGCARRERALSQSCRAEWRRRSFPSCLVGQALHARDRPASWAARRCVEAISVIGRRMCTLRVSRADAAQARWRMRGQRRSHHACSQRAAIDVAASASRKALRPGSTERKKALASALAKDRIKRVERSDQRAVICPGPAACDLPGQPHKLLITLGNPLGNGVTVAQQTLTLFVLVRIQVPQPPHLN